MDIIGFLLFVTIVALFAYARKEKTTVRELFKRWFK